MNDSRIWTVLLIILVLFTGVIIYARHVTIEKQNSFQPIVARYSNHSYAVNLRYPPEWQPASGDYDRYEGRDGFFKVSALSGEGMSVADIAENDAYHKLKPYGSHPTILELKIDGQDARLIMPDIDQDPSMHGQAELIVRYPKPITVGSETYRFLIFWADKAHIQDIASSITLIRS